MKASRFWIGSSPVAAGADCLGKTKASVKRLVRANVRMSVMFIFLTVETQTRRRNMRRQLFFSPLKGSFAAHVEIFHDDLCRLAIRANGKCDAASADGILALRLIGKRVAIVVFHDEGHFLRTLLN